MKIYNILSKSQENLKQILGACPVFLDQILQFARSKAITKTFKKIFNFFLLLHNRYRSIYPGHEYIAKKVGCDERTVRRALSYFEAIGWIWWDQRYMDSNVYQIHPAFTVDKYRIYLKQIFSACSYFMLAQLYIPINAAGAVSDQNVRLLYSSEVIIIEKTIRDPYKRHHITHYLKNTLKKGSIMPNRLVVSEVMKVMDLSESQLLVLDQYNDSQIKRALERTVKKQPNTPEPYFMSVLKSVQQEDVKKGNVKMKVESSIQDQVEIRKALNDRYTLADIEHCEKILALFDRICNEDPVEANLIALGKPSKRWSLSWGTPASFELRLKKLKGE